MSGFDPAWLALREAADGRSRAEIWAQAAFPRRPGGELLRVLDLATGTGANMRYLAPRVAGRQEWVLTDVDTRLLDALPAAMEAWAERRGFSLRHERDACAVVGAGFLCRFRSLRLDLARQLEHLPIRGHGLVTASALLDLVSARWVDDLIERCAVQGADVLFTLAFDGRIEIQPPLADDSLVIDLANRHQRTDKGFGPAMGPAASDITRIKLLHRGYSVSSRASDWRIESEETELQANLIRGWGEAATKMAPEARQRMAAWCESRMELVSKGETRISVGHKDLLGLFAANKGPGSGLI